MSAHLTSLRPINRPTRLAIALLTMTTVASSAVALHVAEPVRAAATIHVDPAGADHADGTADRPVRTVARAVKLARDGDRIVVGSGTYHEQVQVYGKAVELAAAPGATVVFDGATEVHGWSAADGDWRAPWTTGFERAPEPHVLPELPVAGWSEQFFVDGVQLVEVATRGAVEPGTFFYDVAAGQVWIGDDPAGRLVEGSELAWGLYLNHADGSSLTGITVRRYATPYTNMAAIRAYADDLTLRDVTVEDNAYMGVSAIGDNISIERLTARRNGHLGAHAHRSTALSITDSTIVDNNAHGFNFHHAAGGFKVTESAGVVVTDSTVSRNGGPAIWTDLSTSDITVARNLVQDNSRHGIMIELSTAATIVDNVSTGNAMTGIWVLESSDVDVWHNAAFDNFRDLWILDGPRSDVFDVSVVNNTFGGGSAAAQSVIAVDDWTKDRSTGEMNLTMAGNRYWLPAGSPTPFISRFAHWPADLALSATIEQHRVAAGLDGDATFDAGSVNPYTRHAASGDFRQVDGAPLGHPLPGRIALVAGAAANSAHPAGPLSASEMPPAPTTPATPAPTAETSPPAPTAPSSAPTLDVTPVQPATTSTASTTTLATTTPATTTTLTTTLTTTATPEASTDRAGAAAVSTGAAAGSRAPQPAVRLVSTTVPRSAIVVGDAATLTAAATANAAPQTPVTDDAPAVEPDEPEVGWHVLVQAVSDR
ncbi:MAG: DUF1565 domain-containing protein [Ilumatobacter sp.]|nr:DUF1565 domain-containing protein [Ilumatobacter sp.]